MSCFLIQFPTISEWNSHFQITVDYIGKISSNWKVCVKAWTLTPPAMDRKSLWKMEIGQILISKVKGRMTWDRGFLASSSSIACSQRTLYWNKIFVDIFRGKNCNFEITHSFFLFFFSESAANTGPQRGPRCRPFASSRPGARCTASSWAHLDSGEIEE